MQYVRVVTVGLKEVKRTTSSQEAAETLIAECNLLLSEGASSSIRGSCWIEGYLISDDDDMPAALAQDYDIQKRHRWVGIDFFDDVVEDAHKNGWMKNGEWIAETR